MSTAPCPYCQLPHQGDRCPTMDGQWARLHESWDQFTTELLVPVERIRRDPVLFRIAWTGTITGLLVLAVLVDPRVLLLGALAGLAGLAARRQG